MNIKSNTEYVFKTGEKINDDGTIPIIPVCELVRCKDCKFNMANIPDVQDGVNINENWNACELTELYDSVEPEDFCSRGERKDDGTD